MATKKFMFQKRLSTLKYMSCYRLSTWVEVRNAFINEKKFW
jgi:hypothetical protein